MHRLRNLTRRQVILAAGACVLCAAVATAALTGNVGLALTLLAVFFTILFAGLLLIARRLAGLHRAQRRQQADVRTVLDQTQRRVLGAIEELLLHSGDRHRELTDTLVDRMRAQTHELESLVQLLQHVTPRAPMPRPGESELSSTDLLTVLHLIRTRRPRLVLALGSGASTVWMGYALEGTGGKLIALDPDAGNTRAAMTRHGLAEVAQVREAPLKGCDDDFDALADVTAVGLLVIEAPFGHAFGLVKDRLADAATLFCVPDPGWLERIEGLTQEGEALATHAVLSYRRVVRGLSRTQ
ncbi:MAG TPA: class I SAM-dependent methyltransferase [Actinoplanes sp.]|nr:class I SAM-dependent methyltransferase [Actinoplanes sp.]